LTHSADTNRDNRIGLNELLRVAQFYNASGYGCAPAASDPSEDNYLPNADAPKDCARHSADYLVPYWRIELTELLRLIQLFAAQGYIACANNTTTEDGFYPQYDRILPQSESAVRGSGDGAPNFFTKQ